MLTTLCDQKQQVAHIKKKRKRKWVKTKDK